MSGTLTSVGSLDVDETLINGQKTHARTTYKALELMRERYSLKCGVRVDQRVCVPIGSGFGTSGSGAIGLVLSLARALRIRATTSVLGGIAHAADVLSMTGLGTVTPLVECLGPVGIVTEPGPPGVGRVDTIFCDHEDLALVAVNFGPIDKASILKSEMLRRRVNRSGEVALDRIMKDPTLEGLLHHSRIFAEESGLGSKELLDLADFLCTLGALGATQNMIGRAVHAIVPKSTLRDFLVKLRTKFDTGEVIVSDLCQGGPMVARDEDVGGAVENRPR